MGRAVADPAGVDLMSCPTQPRSLRATAVSKGTSARLAHHLKAGAARCCLWAPAWRVRRCPEAVFQAAGSPAEGFPAAIHLKVAGLLRQAGAHLPEEAISRAGTWAVTTSSSCREHPYTFQRR